LARRWVSQGKVWLLPMLLSDYGREIVERKYDAITTDHAYDVRPAGRWGPIGALVDWIILHQDIHVGLRQRLAIVVEEVAAAVRDRRDGGARPVRLASGPCGLARDLRLAWRELGAPSGELELLGLDLDPSGEVLPLAAERAARDGVPLRLARCDLLDHAALAAGLGRRPVDVFLSIGLTVWLEASELAVLLAGFRTSLTPGGILIVDNFRAHGASRFARDLEMETRYHAPAVFERALREAGFVIEAARETANRVNVVYRCRRLPE
jgi:SAM-dependent methyltransferase